MYPKLLHLYGPFELNSFNTLIILGLVVFIPAVLRHPDRAKYISENDFINGALEAALASLAGARLLAVISDWQNYTSLYDIVSFWKGGLSMLGGILGVVAYSLFSFSTKKVPSSFAFFDIIALYAPLIHAIARIGCFLTGCCYGAPTSLPWGIEYAHPLVVAPLHIKIHPTQLYSSLLYCAFFLVLRSVSAQYLPTTGKLLMLYLMGISLERIFVDFFRGDRIVVTAPYEFFSFHQWIALALFGTSLLGFIYIHWRHSTSHPPAQVQ